MLKCLIYVKYSSIYVWIMLFCLWFLIIQHAVLSLGGHQEISPAGGAVG